MKINFLNTKIDTGIIFSFLIIMVILILPAHFDENKYLETKINFIKDSLIVEKYENRYKNVIDEYQKIENNKRMSKKIFLKQVENANYLESLRSLKLVCLIFIIFFVIFNTIGFIIRKNKNGK